MKKSTYRQLVVLATVVPFLGRYLEGTLGLAPMSLPGVYEIWLADDLLKIGSVLVLLVLSLLFLMFVAHVYGLLRFRSWGPKISVWYIAASVIALSFAPPVISSGVANAASSLGEILLGVVVALAYCSPDVKKWFWPEKE